MSKYCPRPSPAAVPGPDDVHWTYHAVQRWDERTPADSAAPETAFAHARPVTGGEFHPHFDRPHPAHPAVDRVYVYAGVTRDWCPYTMLFIEADDAVITTYPLASVHDPGVRGQIAAIVRDRGVVYE